MTIATKPAGQEKKENEENKIKDALGGGEGVVEGSVNASADSELACERGSVSYEALYESWRRRRLLSSLCITLLMLWLIMAGVIGGIVLFKYLHQKPVFHGWCGSQYTGPGMGNRGAYFQERVEVDPNRQLERIEVPQFGYNRPAVFIHDFRQNITAIVDRAGGQCFIRDLDRVHISHPQSFIDLVKKMESGYYDLDPEIVREEYRVRQPALSERDLLDLDSTMVTQYCQNKHTFWLQKQFTATQRIHKRSVCPHFAEINEDSGGKGVVLQQTICLD